MPYILQTSHLGKMINGKELVTDVNIHVKKGEIYGFLGPNGAGKSTLMKIMCGVYAKDSGRMLLENENTGEFEEVEDKNTAYGTKSRTQYGFSGAKSSGEYEYCREYFYRKRTCKKEWVS